MEIGAEPATQTPAAWVWIVPLLAYMAVPMLLERVGIESLSRKTFAGPRPVVADWGWLIVVAAQVVVGAGLLTWGWSAYVRSLPLRISGWSVPLGLFGLGLWIGLCELDWEQHFWALLSGLGFQPAARPSINPSESFPDGLSYPAFLAFRFLGLVAVVPLAEELLLRGFFLRMLQREDWWNVSMNQLSATSVLVSGLYGVVTHPNEMVAAFVWFAAVTAWVRWCNRFWDGVMIHAVTNAALGAYVMGYQQWHLW